MAGTLEAPENETEEGRAEAAAAAGEGGGPVPAGVPDFWSTALRTHPALAELITDKDAEVLAFLSDVRGEELNVEGDDGDVLEGFRLVFTFAPNPFFSNRELSKLYLLGEQDGDQMLAKIEGTEIKWAPGKDVTTKVR